MIWGCLAFPIAVSSSWSLPEVLLIPQEMPFALSQMCLSFTQILSLRPQAIWQEEVIENFHLLDLLC